MPRKKRKNFKLSFAYKMSKFIPLNPDRRLKFYLDMAWIFSRLAHEETFKAKTKVGLQSDFLHQRIKENDAILDVGCGKGFVIERLLSKTKNITGIDYDKKSIKEAQMKLVNVNFICADVFDYLQNAEDIRFDVIVLSHVLEHIDSPNEFIKRISRRAKHFYIEVPDFEATHLNLYRQRIGTDLIYTDADHVSEFDRTEIELLIANANLKVVDAEFRYGVMKYWCESQI
jgi:SAM-dependent methyltransferase